MAVFNPLSAAAEARNLFDRILGSGGQVAQQTLKRLPGVAAGVQRQVAAAPVISRGHFGPIKVPQVTVGDLASNVRSGVKKTAADDRRFYSLIGQRNLSPQNRAFQTQHISGIVGSIGGGSNTQKAIQKQLAKPVKNAFERALARRDEIVDVIKRHEVGQGFLPGGQADLGLIPQAEGLYKLLHNTKKIPKGMTPEKLVYQLKHNLRAGLAQEKVRTRLQNATIKDAGVGLGLGMVERGPLPVGPTKKIGLLQQGLGRTRNVLASQGPAGQQLAQGLRSARDQAETTAGSWVARLPTVRRLSKPEFQNFVDVAEGKAQPLNAKVGMAAQEWDSVRKEVHQTATGAGLDVGTIENYFPHRFDPKLFTDKNRFNEAVNHLVQSGQAQTSSDAVAILRQAQDTVRNRRFGNLELERLMELPSYERTPEALMGYLEGSANRIGQATQFGKQDEKAMGLLSQLGKQGFDTATATEMFNTAVGAKKYGETSTKISKGLRAYQATTKLGLGAITNVGQNVNTATVTGLINTAKALPKALSAEGRDYALRAGVTLDGVINDLREGSGFSGKVLGKITAPGFGTVEKFNRTLAAHAGKNYAEDLARKAAQGSRGAQEGLRKLGLDPNAISANGGRLSEADAVTAARNIVERTQFKVDPQDLPGWTNSPWGKVLTQFKRFSYNQTAFLGKEVVAPAIKGDARPLLRFLALAIPTGAAIKETRNVLQNRRPEEDPTKRTIQYGLQAGGGGLVGDVYTGLFPQNSKYLPKDRAATMAISTLGGPTLGGLVEGYGSLAVAAQGDPTSLGRFGLKQIPIAGTTLQNTLLPYQGAEPTASALAAKTYEQLKQLPPDQANQQAKQLKASNPALYRMLKAHVRAVKSGASPDELKLAGMGVVNEERVKGIVQGLKKFTTADEKNAYLKRLKNAGIVTPDVMAQLKALRQKGAL